MDRIENLKQLKQSLAKLREETILVQLKGLSQTLDTVEESNLKVASEMILKLSKKIVEFSGKYTVKYIGELYNYQTNTYYQSEPHTETLYLDTICVIDTDKDDDLTTNTDKVNLFKEISDFLYIGRYTNFKIVHIKSLDS